MEIHYRGGSGGDETTRAVKVAPGAGEGRFTVSLDGGAPRAVAVERAEQGRLVLAIDGRRVEARIAGDGTRRFVEVAGRSPESFERAEARRPRSRAREKGGEGLIANMHGQVVAVPVKPGDVVERGATLVIIEAMKMEVRVTAPHRGKVASISCKPGEIVERGRVLVELEAAPG